jgi:hypothetical protein
VSGCPNCRANERKKRSSQSPASVSESVNLQKIENLLEQVVRSTGKTTHAVRAFVRFLFIQLSATSLAGVLIYLGTVFARETEGALIGLGIITYVVGVIWSSSAGWSELKQSE